LRGEGKREIMVCCSHLIHPSYSTVPYISGSVTVFFAESAKFSTWSVSRSRVKVSEMFLKVEGR